MTMPVPDDHAMREARSVLEQLKAEGSVRREHDDTVRMIAAAMAVIRDPSRSLANVCKQHGVLKQSVSNKIGAVRAVMQTRGATGPAPLRGLVGNRFAVLEHACVDGPPALQPPQSVPGKARTSARHAPAKRRRSFGTVWLSAALKGDTTTAMFGDGREKLTYPMV